MSQRTEKGNIIKGTDIAQNERLDLLEWQRYIFRHLPSRFKVD